MQVQTAAADLTRHNLTIDGARIVVHETGHGLPLLMLHGSPDTHAMWLPLIDRLGGEFRAIAPDMPGYGQSTLPADFSLSLDHMADFVRDLLAALDIHEPVVLMVTDFGAHYGLAFAAKYPEQVRGVVISAATFHSDYRWHFYARLYRIPLLGEFLLAGSNRRTIASALKKFAPALPDHYIRDSYASGFGSRSVRRAILRHYRARRPDHFTGWEEKAAAVLTEKPALVLWGDRDPFVSPAYADRFGGAEVHHFPNNSHWLPLEAPDQYAAILLPWLRRL